MMADIILEELRRAQGPLRSVQVWGAVTPKVNRAGVSAVLVALEKRGLVKRERRFDQDGDEIASHWSLL